ncbi:MAG: phenylalanine--tRNA ligase beta subunit-related protein [Planctomycetota bacterium]
MSGAEVVVVHDALPGLVVRAVSAALPRPLGALDAQGAAPPASPAPEEVLRCRVRDVLRQRGYRPTGRGKPSSEYLAAAARDGRWPRVNAAVDAANLVSLACELPVSVVDAARLRGEWAVRVPAPGERYVFNASGQEIDVAGLPCLVDDDGPCANAVKDSQRTKTSSGTTALLAIVWGVEPAALVDAAAAALRDAFAALGASAAVVPVHAASA